MSCANCPSEVPIIQADLAYELVRRMREHRLEMARRLSIDWLLEKHPGLLMYQGITGRGYTPEESPRIAEDQAELAQLPCPFFLDTGCCLGPKGLGPEYLAERRGADYGFLPMLIMRCLDRSTLRELVSRREIADAKIALLNRPHTLYTRANRLTGRRDTVRSREARMPAAASREAVLVT